MNFQSRRITVTLRALQIFFYLAFVFLWFKDNFPPARKLHLSPAYPLVCLILVSALRAFMKIRSSQPRLKFKFTKDWCALVLIIVLVTAVHVPYLVYHDGLMDGDEAIPALQGKHIAEGKIPAIYYYGALFQGSFPQQYYAVFFKIFGYSVLTTKIAAFLAFVCFLVVQFLLVKNIFSRGVAFVVGLFYILPFNNLILSSFDVGSGFAVVFFLGSLMFTWTYLVYDRRNDNLLPALGFLMGLAFWTHQISVIFILTSGIFLILRYKLQIKKYLTLALYALIGAFPILMSEIYFKFPLMRMLFGGESAGILSGSKISRLKRLTLDLISSGPDFLNWLYLALLILGFGVLVSFSVRNKRFLASALFPVYVFAYMAVYLLSSSSNVEVIRYLFILYLVIPVLFAAAFLTIKSKAVSTVVTVLFFLFLFFVSGWKTSATLFRTVRTMDIELSEVMAAMDKTGEKYWKANYWISYLLNSVGKERFIVASTTVERYPYYQLAYDSESPHMNYIIFRDSAEEEKKATDLVGLMSRLAKKFETRSVNRWILIYGINGYIYNKNLFFPPDSVPDVALESIGSAENGIVFRFAPKSPILTGGYRMHVEIVDYCKKFTPVPAGEKFSLTLPFPPQKKVRIKYYLDFQGLFLDSTLRELEHELPSPTAPLRRDPVEYLSGFGPREKATEKRWTACEKDIRFQINQPQREWSKISLTLYSPFAFNDPFWHGEFAQEVSVFVNGQPYHKKNLADGHNTLTIDCRRPPFQSGSNIVELKFKYAMVVSIQDHWKTAAYLEDLKID